MNQISKTKIPIAYVAILFFALATMNVINRYYYFAYLAVAIFCVEYNRKFRLDKIPIVLLLVLAVSWVFFSPNSTDSIFGILKPFTYVLCYIVGTSLLNDDMEYSEDKLPLKLFYITLIAVAAGSLGHYLLNWLSNAGSMDRNTVDFWSGTVMAATGQAALACLPLGLAIGCLFGEADGKTKGVAVVTVFLVLGYNLILSGRTLIIMFLAITAIGFLHKLSTLKSGKTKLLLIFIAIIALLLLVYRFNILNVRSYIESSPIYDRFFAEDSDMELDEDGRMRKKLYHLTNMHRNLFGGAHIREEIGHSHDIFLDTYDEAGIFAFVAIVLYLLISFIHLVKCVKDKTLPFSFRSVVLCVYAIVYMEFVIEPILQGMPWLFATFCLIDGYVSRILSHNTAIKLRELEQE